MKKRIYIIAGENSGDILGFRLMQAMKEINPNIEFYGVGGENMIREGLKSLFSITDISVMGIYEVFKNLSVIKKRIKETIQDIESVKPDVIITIDSLGFNLRVLKAIKHLNIPLLHYVAPTVWFWKPNRALEISKVYNHLFCILPFEPKYFTIHGLETTFVGHPIMESGIENISKDLFYKENNIPLNKKIITILPGSRAFEIKNTLPLYKDIVNSLQNDLEDAVFVIPTFLSYLNTIKNETKSWKIQPLILEGMENRYKLFKATSVAVAVSGTVSLELGLAKTPTIIIYKLNYIRSLMAKIVLNKKKFITIVNILANKMLMPEYLLENATAKNIAKKIKEYYNEPNKANVNEIYSTLQELKANKDNTSSQMVAKKIYLILTKKDKE